ncbi:hypothetical protein [Micavibrio aeruginosavorus]|uniref:Lipoprotein n=1 Tax=Micavibrio aeruginosavorus EPB TaxID=349215 RepID=M4VI72_9BACT|nr:hypothetical protein [Micavibrio aeruginosavorus]AGH98185.1 hypothetical protein A11S_1376 [Micavibrio aeruginosavorus EPB]
MNRLSAFTLCLLALSMPLVACGVKPGHVDAPATAQSPDTFPQTYPAPATDPEPTYRKRAPAPKPANADQAGSGLQF